MVSNIKTAPRSAICVFRLQPLSFRFRTLELVSYNFQLFMISERKYFAHTHDFVTLFSPEKFLVVQTNVSPVTHVLLRRVFDINKLLRVS